MVEFFQFLFLWIVGGKKGREELGEIYAWQAREMDRMRRSRRNFIDTIDEIMNDSTADLLCHHRRYRETHGL